MRIKYKAGIIIFVLATSLAHAAAPMPPLPAKISIEEAVQIALQSNPDGAVVRQRIAEAQAVTELVSAQDFPQIRLSADYTQTENPMFSFGNILNQGEFDQTIDFNDPGRTDNAQLKAEIAYRIYNGGRNKAEENAAAAKLEAVQTDLQKVQRQLGYIVVKTYYAIVQSQKMLGVRQQALESITAALAVGKARYREGDLLKQDLLNLELQQSSAKEDLIVSRLNLDLTKKRLLHLLGYQNGTFAVEEPGTGKQAIPEDTDYHRRSELLALRKMENAALAALAKARGEKRPTVDGFASYQFDTGLETGGNGDSWMAGIKINYNLYDGGVSQAQIAIAQAKLHNLRAQIRKTELDLHLEIEQAKLEYYQAKERLKVTEKMVVVAEEVAQIARVRFKEGVILSSDLIDFETRLSDAQARHLSAEATYQVAIANVRRASGFDQFPK